MLLNKVQPSLPQCYYVQGLRAGRLGIMPHPPGYAGLAASLEMLLAQGADMLVSLLEPDEALALGLADEENSCRLIGLEFRSFPIADFGIPALDDSTLAFMDELAAYLQDEGNLVIHCYGGIGRSSLVAAAVMIRSGIGLEAALRAIRNARGTPVPETEAQRAWLDRFAGRYGG